IQYQTAQAIGGLGQGGGGGEGGGNVGESAGLGAGFGMGMAMGEAMRQAMSGGQKSQQQQTAPAQSNQKEDVIGLLKQLAELRDVGVITVEEFESKKADLLSRL